MNLHRLIRDNLRGKCGIKCNMGYQRVGAYLNLEIRLSRSYGPCKLLLPKMIGDRNQASADQTINNEERPSNDLPKSVIGSHTVELTEVMNSGQKTGKDHDPY